MEKIRKRAEKTESLLCIGLDPDPALVPDPFGNTPSDLFDFLSHVIQATESYATAFKPNMAYFEALGVEGIQLLERVLKVIPEDLPVIADAKRGDVGHSSKHYAESLFSHFGFDAATVSPYLGQDSLEAFLEYPEHGVFVLCLTSNSGARDFQLPELHLKVARRVREWNRYGNSGLVVGATHPESIAAIRKVSGPMPYLIPGIGVQGGELETTLKAARDGTEVPCLINASRSILYPAKAGDSIASSRNAAIELHGRIRSLLEFN